MSTEDVPGYREENRDVLAMGCWAEHQDGSLVFVQSTEGGRVVYEIYDLAQSPVMKFQDAMAEGAFKKAFSYHSGEALVPKDKWVWHDKTPFPFDRVIKAGVRAGERFADVEEQISEAERIARRRRAEARRAYGPRDEERVQEMDEAYEFGRSLPDNAAQRARRARDIQQGAPVDLAEFETRMERIMGKGAAAIATAIQGAIGKLKPGKAKR